MQPQWGPAGSPSGLRGGGGWWHPPGSLLIVAALFLYQARVTMTEGDSLISVDYEVFGKVQGVFFRKYTQAEGKKLGLVGWVQNTEDGTVQGQIQGPSVKVRELQEWLRKTGSPKSHINRAEFRNEKKIVALEYRNFSIVK
ncbi:acylphosphatase-1 isoform X1 [Trachemys scripta elegans]|uniref:acylphosphatase-1 isoform X1 n=1 Tax=Trachemys scripta elegans TaxID=31138 RepID=UPI001557E0D1|nr:acylphosphatase-1 isoform X1 [Trachemys scripta elegans]XP_053884336.1 acylphosphatase-1 isoform X1 [Malaclemys terrapin pileata]